MTLERRRPRRILACKSERSGIEQNVLSPCSKHPLEHWPMGTPFVDSAHEFLKATWRVIIWHLRDGFKRFAQSFAPQMAFFLGYRWNLAVWAQARFRKFHNWRVNRV
jgi:hypothetical protein